MSIVNTEKRVINKTIKDTVIALGITLASIVSINASAQAAPTIEAAISKFVIAQSQEMMNQINEQLQQTIAKEVKKISFNVPVKEVAQQVSKKMAKDVELVTMNNEQVTAQVESKI